MSRRRLDAVRQLALYGAFHRAALTRTLHAVFVPVVFFTGVALLRYVRLPMAHPLARSLDANAPLALALTVVLATIDPLGALLLLALLAVAWLAAGALMALASPWVLAPLLFLAHCGAWYVLVGVAHQRFEPAVRVGGASEDSNLYFRRGYYLGRSLGAPVGTLDAVIQFCIAPLAIVQDGLALLGLRCELQEQIVRERERILERIARGEAPIGSEP